MYFGHKSKSSTLSKLNEILQILSNTLDIIVLHTTILYDLAEYLK